jgi:hypothetical protein
MPALLGQVQFCGSSKTVQICFQKVTGADVIASPEFEELGSGQRPSSYKALFSIGLADCKVDSAKYIFGCVHGLLLLNVRDANLVNGFELTLLGTANQKQGTTYKECWFKFVHFRSNPFSVLL